MVTGTIALLKTGLSKIGTLLIGGFKKVSTDTKRQTADVVNHWVNSWRKGAVQVQQAKRAGEQGGSINTGGLIQGAAGAASLIGKIGAIFSWVTLAVSAITFFVQLVKQFSEEAKSVAQQIEEYEKLVEDTRAKAATSRADVQNLEELAKKWTDLNESVEKNTTKKEEWLSINKQLAEQYPSLIEGISDEGTAIVSLIGYYDDLLASKRANAELDAAEALRAVNRKYENPNLLYADVIKDDKFKHEEGYSREDTLFENYSAAKARDAVLNVELGFSEWESKINNELEKLDIEWPEDSFFSVENWSQSGGRWDSESTTSSYQEMEDRFFEMFGLASRIEPEKYMPILNAMKTAAGMDAAGLTITPVTESVEDLLYFDSAFNDTKLASRFRGHFEQVA